jgi:hypothetical protein
VCRLPAVSFPVVECLITGPRTAAALDNASISASRSSSLSPTLDSISAKLGAPSVSVSKKRKVPADTPCLDPADLPKKHCASHQDLSRSSEPDVRTLSGPSSSLDAGPPAMHSQTPSTERPSSKLLPPAAPTVEPSSVPPDTPRQPTLSVDDMSPSTLVPTADLPATRASLDAPPVADEGPTLSKAARRRARFAQQCVKDRPTRDPVADKPTRDPAAAETAPPAHVPDRSGSLEPGEIATPAVPLKLGAGKARAARMARVRERLEAERDARAAECAQFKAERDARAAECAQLEAERDAQSNACAQLVAERDARAAECAQLEAERDARSMECAQLAIVRDTRAAEYAQLMQERDTLLRAHERAEAERDTSAARTRELEEALRELGVDVPEQPAGTHALASGDCTPREVSDDLSGLTAERDRLAKEYLLLSTQRRRLKGELARTGTERDALRAEALSWQEKAQEAETTQRTTQGERDALRQDCARLETHLADAIAEHEAVTHFAHTISTARDATMAERDIVLAERDAAVAERNAVRVERDVARAEQDVLAAKLCAAVVERDEARAAVAAACKTAAATAMASACEELLRLREALDAVVHQAAAERGDSERLRAEHGNAAAVHVSALADLRAELNASRSAEQTRLVAEFDAVRAAHHIAHSNLQNELRRTSAERDAFAQEVKTFKVEQNIMRLEHDAACAGRDDALAQLKEVCTHLVLGTSMMLSCGLYAGTERRRCGAKHRSPRAGCSTARPQSAGPRCGKPPQKCRSCSCQDGDPRLAHFRTRRTLLWIGRAGRSRTSVRGAQDFGRAHSTGGRAHSICFRCRRASLSRVGAGRPGAEHPTRSGHRGPP